MTNDHGRPAQDAARWFATAPGRVLLRAQQQGCANIVSNVFGHLSLALRCQGVPVDLLSESQVLTAFTLDCDASARSIHPVQASAVDLPVCSGCLQLVVVHHLHETVERPAALLREVERILAPSGVAVLAGMNPLGRRLRWRPAPSWVRHWQAPESLSMTMDRIGLRTLFVRAVYSPDSGLQRMAAGMEKGPLREVAKLVGSGYLIAARKSDHPGRIVNGRDLVKSSGRGIADTAPSAGMSPANADRGQHAG